MKFSKSFERIFRAILPSPFSIALILTIVTVILAFILKPSSTSFWDYSNDLFVGWNKEMWSNNKLAFAVQMMLMLLLGHILALSKPVEIFLSKLVSFCTSNIKAAIYITFFTILISLFNWGLGLIFGAIFVRKIGENAQKYNLQINYPLLGACAYVGLMVWHGGISGSAPIKVSDEGHLKSLLEKIIPSDLLHQLPNYISFNDTVFSNSNIYTSLSLLIILPILAWLLAKKNVFTDFKNYNFKTNSLEAVNNDLTFAEKIDHSRYFLKSIGTIILVCIIYNIFSLPFEQLITFRFIHPNFINLLLLALCFISHKNSTNFLKSVDEGISGISGILIQFPLYFGIMGLMISSGLIDHVSNWVASTASSSSLPYFTFISAGIVNIFVPSGGGQWMVQGPIIMKASLLLDVPLNKTIMALSYGDQLTNMLQPFWALPLLGITKLKAKDILPYCLMFFIAGGVLFMMSIWLFW